MKETKQGPTKLKFPKALATMKRKGYAKKSKTVSPSLSPTSTPSSSPSGLPSKLPTKSPTTSPTQSPTSPTSSPTKNPTASPTTSPSSSPVACEVQQLVTNPGFEVPDAATGIKAEGWDDIATPFFGLNIGRNGGSRASELTADVDDGDISSEDGVLQTLITIDDIGRPWTLSFFFKIITCDNVVDSFFSVNFVTSTGQETEVFNLVCEDETMGFEEVTVDVTMFAGQTVTLVLRVEVGDNDEARGEVSSSETRFVIVLDDVTITSTCP